MPAIVEFPTVVKEAVSKFGSLFANEPERVHFAEYMTGLLVAGRKNISAMNREFAVTTDQSCLNRWLTEVDWDVEELKRQRLRWLQKDPAIRSTAQHQANRWNSRQQVATHLSSLNRIIGDHEPFRRQLAHASTIMKGRWSTRRGAPEPRKRQHTLCSR